MVQYVKTTQVTRDKKHVETENILKYRSLLQCIGELASQSEKEQSHERFSSLSSSSKRNQTRKKSDLFLIWPQEKQEDIALGYSAQSLLDFCFALHATTRTSNSLPEL